MILQAGALPKKAYIAPSQAESQSRKDLIAMYDVVQRVKTINRAFEKAAAKDGDGDDGTKDKISFM